MQRTLVLFLVGCLLVACEPSKRPVDRSLTLGAYTTPREVYGKKLIPGFTQAWKVKHQEDVHFQESYLGSGAQARAIVGGFEADVAALSLAPDIMTLVKAGLVEPTWSQGSVQGMVSQSIVVLAVRAGNPKGIKDWEDIAKPGINVVTPNVRTSGGAMWNIAAIYGAVLRGKTSLAADKASASDLMKRILANVSVMDKGARESLITFEQGVGDVAITYENEVIAAKRAGRSYDYVIPRATLLIENPVAIVTAVAKKHGTLDLAQEFVAYLSTADAQRAFAEFGYRPVLESVKAEHQASFPAVEDLFTVRDLGGWDTLQTELFQPGALYEQAIKK